MVGLINNINKSSKLYHIFQLALLLLFIRVNINLNKEEKKMKSKLMVSLAAGALMITTVLPLGVQAGRGNGSMGGARLQTRTQSPIQQRLRDGSCVNPVGAQAGSGLRKGKGYGPGDGTGNRGVRPLDGSGYGAPVNR
jgi:hypothetical protein